MSELMHRLSGKSSSVPFWFMRQAGRYLPEYREIRKNRAFLEVCKNPELACEVTLQPLRRFPLSAAIIFSDILVIPEAMGMNLEFIPGSGPKLTFPDGMNIDGLVVPDPAVKLAYVGEVLKRVKKHLQPTQTLIGFSGAPITLLTYMIKGASKGFTTVKKQLIQNRATIHCALKKLTESIIDYLIFQKECGAQVVQLFDTWGGILPKELNMEFNLPYVARILKSLKKIDLPTIYFMKNGQYMLSEILQLPMDCLSIDYTASIEQMLTQCPKKLAIQGNLDPTFLYSDSKTLTHEVNRILTATSSRNNFLFNLGHGLLPTTPIDSLMTVCKTIQKFNQKREQA